MELYYFPIAITLHVLAAVVWVGGMFFAYMALRPVAASLLEPPVRLTLWSKTLMRFFIWVWLAIIIIPFTGYWMIFSAFNGFAGVAWYVHVMQALGIIMILIFLHVFFAPYMRLRKSLKEENYQLAGSSLNQIRKLVGLNLFIGLITIISAVGFEHIPI
ncbi:MAG: CopD family protein [Pseudomonadota bacterium]